jgi:hypothetical protein
MGGFEVVDPRYVTLYERAAAVLEGDPRVIRVEASGSIAAGTADAWSDLDLTVVARADAHAALLEEWPAWISAITPTVFARAPIAPFIINTVTDAGLTFDVAVYPGSARRDHARVRGRQRPAGDAAVVRSPPLTRIELASDPFADAGP